MWCAYGRKLELFGRLYPRRTILEPPKTGSSRLNLGCCCEFCTPFDDLPCRKQGVWECPKGSILCKFPSRKQGFTTETGGQVRALDLFWGVSPSETGGLEAPKGGPNSHFSPETFYQGRKRGMGILPSPLCDRMLKPDQMHAHADRG